MQALLVRVVGVSAFLFSLIGCRTTRTTKPSSLPVRFLEPVDYVASLDGDRFLANVTGIYPTKNVLFLIDTRAFEKLLLLDHQLELITAFGRKGDGPGEVGNVRMGALWNDRFFVYDPSHRAMQVFDTSGGFVHKIDLPMGTRNPFVMGPDGHFYFSTYHKDEPITRIDPEGRIVAAFGTWYHPTEDGRERRARNGRTLAFTEGHQLISIGETEPILEVYSADGALISSQELKGGPRLARRIAHVEEEYRHSENRYVTVILTDAAWSHGGLLYVSHPLDTGAATGITVFRREAKRFVPEREILLTSGIEGDSNPVITPPATAPDGTIFAYDRRLNRLYRYDSID